MSGKLSLPRPEYPRPQLVRARWLSLNGLWKFEMDPNLTREEKYLDSKRRLAGTITVPFCPESGLSGIGEKGFMPCVWYRRTFTLPGDWQDKRIILHLGAVDYQTTVWVNGEKAGEHRGGYSPFSLEITQLVKRGENCITVRALDDTRSPLQPSGKQSMEPESSGCCYTRTTGIWQTVWLEAVPHSYLKSFRLYPDLDEGKLTVQADVDGDTDGFTLSAKALASGGKVGEARTAAGGEIVLVIELSEVHPWGPGSPFLYDLELSLERDGGLVDSVKSYFGLRKVHVDGKKVLINNKPVFQRLVLDQGYYPGGIYTAPSDEALRRDIELAMDMGFNGARLHQKVFEPRFLYWADRLGYLVWGEYPNWGLDHSHPEALEVVREEWAGVLERDFNHPSIVGWCLFNETPASQDPKLLRGIYRLTKSADPTRPVIDTSGYLHVETDIYDCHNYEQDPEKFAAVYEEFKTGERVWRNFPEKNAPYAGQPYFVSEYGGIWWNPGQTDDKSWGYGDRPKSKEEFLERYRALTEALLLHPKMFGFCYTQLCDIEQEVNGLYTYDRRPKFDPALIKAINSQPAVIERD